MLTGAFQAQHRLQSRATGSSVSQTGSPISGNIIVNPSGPGIGPNSGTIADHITLVATQP